MSKSAFLLVFFLLFDFLGGYIFDTWYPGLKDDLEGEILSAVACVCGM